MGYDKQIGSVELRAEVVDKVIKGFATASYKFKQALSIATTNAWKNDYFRESSQALTGHIGNQIKGLPRGANFPQAVVKWDKIESYIEKYGLEDNILWEDVLTDDIDVQSRTLFRIAEGVTKAIDDEIWDVLSEGQVAAPPNILSFSIAKNYHWDGSSSAVIDDLMHASQLISEYNYPTDNLIAFVSPKDYRSIMKTLTDSGAQFPAMGTEVARNGRMGRVAGVQLIKANSVSASQALVVVPKICGTWRAAVPLRTETIIDPFKSTKIRAVEMGVTQLTDPAAVCLIRGTQFSS